MKTNRRTALLKLALAPFALKAAVAVASKPNPVLKGCDFTSFLEESAPVFDARDYCGKWELVTTCEVWSELVQKGTFGDFFTPPKGLK